MYKTFEEKETDVNIAITVLELASKNQFDKIVLLSGDSDFIPVIKTLRDSFPNKKTHLIIPIHGRAERLKEITDQYSKMKYLHIKRNLFPDRIEQTHGFIEKPDEW